MNLHFWMGIGAATRQVNKLKLADRRASRLFAVLLTLLAIGALALLLFTLRP